MQTTEIIKQTFEIKAINVAYFTGKVAKLNKRAAKLGLEDIIWAIVARRRDPILGKEIPGGMGEREVVGYEWITTLDVCGVSPCLSGYAIAAVIEHTSAGNLLRDATGGAVDLSAYRDIGPTCDHCKVSRRRNETVLLIRDDQTLVRVGKSCLKDYLGHSTIAQLAWRADFACLVGEVEDLDGSGECYGGREPASWDLLDFLGWCAAAKREFGYITRTRARESIDGVDATCDVAAAEMALYYFSPSKYQRELEAGRAFACTDEDRELAQKALDFTIADLQKIKSSDSDQTFSDFHHNLEVICNLGTVGEKHKGFAGAILGYYTRAVQGEAEKAGRDAAREAREAAQAEKAERSSHVGEVGEKVIVEVVIGSTRDYYNDDWGYTYFVAMETLAGDVLTWKSSNNPRLEPGARCFVRGTVKEHGEFRGVAQTTLIRCAVRCPICHVEGAFTKTGRARKGGAPFKDLKRCSDHWGVVPVLEGGGFAAD